ncbi:MAG: BREX-1 system adenine-specific DNA-methyltransferase PglX [Brevibacterium sp.]|uniref:site-specific DNA-methyltransferase (adenine-specific) n=1 Tax=Brevibacterium aurantiacum TaxID=273384 RepID=A0A2A3WZX5_BREAU|nr:hypothetical protein [Brevibacterium aurantiacum]MDN5585417.1 BREX-1 system adenine-specific DNA-methyltransferase PglX [Brevibacterium sp.]PCC16966.1 hypothetical protein CIK79_00855 [Brevibacterium aurantiacum]
MTTAMTTVLNSDQRRFLDAQTQRARAASEHAAEDALRALAVSDLSRPAYLTEEQNKLRLALRDKARQLGDDTSRADGQLTNLIHDVAYEQWHRLLFARFLEVNELLRHPEYRDIPLSLEDCGDFAPDLGEPDAWAVAARFASEILPGVFRLTDPAVRVRFAPEHRNSLERLLLEIPAEVFTTEDALGWVYQFWQTAEKKRVNDSGVKIGGADLSPVTQLFTENYMVRFLLENSLGAWWAARHPESPLVGSWEYLRRNEDGTPAAGSFDDWPEHAAEVTIMDPCCGSGHFLVAMFGMLWRMRAEEEGLTPAEAQDAVLRDNLHGLELDPRCTQIATFNVALEAWKQGGFRDLPAPQIACSGVPVRASVADWEALANGDKELEKTMGRLHASFRNANKFGSLIDPRPGGGSGALFDRDLSINVSLVRLRDLLAEAGRSEFSSGNVLGQAAQDVAQAAVLLGASYTLVATNPPYLGQVYFDDDLRNWITERFPDSSYDLYLAFLDRVTREQFARTVCFVCPDDWLIQVRTAEFKNRLLDSCAPILIASTGYESFATPLRVHASMQIFNTGQVKDQFTYFDVGDTVPYPRKAGELQSVSSRLMVTDALRRRDWKSLPRDNEVSLEGLIEVREGLKAGDANMFERFFWEVNIDHAKWDLYQDAPNRTDPFVGRQKAVLWEQASGRMFRLAESVKGRNHVAQNWRRGMPFWGKQGICFGLMGSLPATVYLGEKYSANCAVVIPKDPGHFDALWRFAESGEWARAVREWNHGNAVTPHALAKVTVDLDHWKNVALDAGELPEPHQTDPTQWVFSGSILRSDHPLQVAVAKLMGFRWPSPSMEEAPVYQDLDGIAALVSLPNEPDLATRVRGILSATYGTEWSSTLERTLVTETGVKSGRLEDWLRDSFFAQHVKVFDNRPFLWHIWDGRKDGFSAIVNYHKLDRQALEKLTFTSLGAWIDRQKDETRAERAGADARLAAAEDLQHRLQLILEGAPPYDSYVRWKPMAEQPIGWEPDLDDGVRLNIRPFVTAGVLRSKVNVHWKKDRGTNADGSERHNDLHPTLDERRAARKAAEATE